MLAILLPWLQGNSASAFKVAASFLVLFSLVFAFNGIRHQAAFQENRILGRECLPVAIGCRATRWVAFTLMASSSGIIVWLANSSGLLHR